MRRGMGDDQWRKLSAVLGDRIAEADALIASLKAAQQQQAGALAVRDQELALHAAAIVQLQQMPSPISILADDPPSTESVTAKAGIAPKASRRDHSHPRLSSTFNSADLGTLDASGDRVIPFTRTFDTPPAIACVLVEEVTAAPVTFKVKSWLKAGAQAGTLVAWTSGAPYAGFILHGDRARGLPALQNILLIGPLITALASFLPYVSAAGAGFTGFALMSSK